MATGDDDGGRSPGGSDQPVFEDRLEGAPAGAAESTADPAALAVDATLLAPGPAPASGNRPSDALAADATIPAAAPGSVDSNALTFRRDQAPLSRQAPPKIGRYLVIEPLGEGGMGVVYAAYDPQLDRKVAIKLVRPAYTASSGDEAQARLVREAQALARLRHPNVAGVYEVDAFGSEVYVAMEFVDGVTLRTWQFEHARSWREIVRVYIAAGRGLAAAHHAGIVHRDFKPDNVLVTPAGEPRVLDFGLAFREEDPSPPAIDPSAAILSTQLTMTGALLGTPAYMSPEQHRGAPADARSDVFAFCASLFEALYGVRPFNGATMIEISTALFSGQITAASTFVKVPAWLRRVVVRGLRVDPDQRYQDMDALLRALAADPARYLSLGAGLLLLGGVALAFVWLLRSAEGAQTIREVGARVRADFDHQRALANEEALAQARGRSGVAHYNAWIVAVARERLSSDPEGALAILKQVDRRSIAWLPEARMIAAEALTRGIPRRSREAGANRVRALAFAPGGDLLITGDEGGSVEVRGVEGDEIIAAITGPAAILAIAAARTASVSAADEVDPRVGLRIALVAADGSIGLWEVDGAVRWLGPHPGGALSVALSPGGERIASGGVDGRVRIAGWGGEVLHVFPTHRVAVNALTFGADAETLASGGADGGVILWNLEGNTRRALEGLRGSVRELVFDRQAGRLFALSGRGEARSWTIGDEVQSVGVPGDLSHLRAVGGRLLGVDVDGKRLLDLDRPRPRPLLGADDEVVAVDLSDDGAAIAFAGASGRVELWDARPVTASPLGQVPGRVRALAWSHAGDHLAVASRSGAVHLWTVAGADHRPLRSRGVSVVSLAFSADDRVLVSGDEDRGVRAWDLEDAAATPKILRPPSALFLSEPRFSGDGAVLQSACSVNSCVVVAIDPSSGARTTLLEVDGAIDRFAVADDGAWALTAGARAPPILWRRAADGPLRATPLEIPSAAITWVAAVIGEGPRGRLAGTREGRFEVWEVEPGEGQAHLIYDDRELERVDIDPRGEAALISDGAGERRIWRLREARLHRLPTCVERVARIEVSADDARVMIVGGARDAGANDVACIIDLGSGASRQLTPGGEPWAWDGDARLASVSAGDQLLLWDDPTPDDPEGFLRWLAVKTGRTIELERLRRP